MYGSVPSISSGGPRGGCSRASREAMPKSVIFTSPVVGSTRMLCGLDVLVDDAAPVDVRQRGGDLHRQREKDAERHRLCPRAVRASCRESPPARAPAGPVAVERQRLDDRQALERPSELVLVPQPIEVPRMGVLRIEHLEDDDPSVSHPLRSVQGRSLTLLQPLAEVRMPATWSPSGPPPPRPRLPSLLPFLLWFAYTLDSNQPVVAELRPRTARSSTTIGPCSECDP